MLQCPKCGGKVCKRGSGSLAARAQGHQIYSCVDRKKCRWRSASPLGIDEELSKGVDRQYAEKNYDKLATGGAKRLVITAAQNATPIEKDFWRTLRRYCDEIEAHLVVIPYRYHNPTSVWTSKDKGRDWWAPELRPFLMDQRVEANPNLLVLGDIKTQPTAVSPLQGFETLTGPLSAIIGHPKPELISIPTPQSKLPKLLATTGAVTEKNYIESKAGKKGEHHHTFGALVVELDDKIFHMRRINATREGTFCDLNRYHHQRGSRFMAARGLVMGDTHVDFTDPSVVRATFGAEGLVNLLRPEYLVWHDVFDFFSRTHHHRGKPIIKFLKHHAGRDNVREELARVAEFVNKHAPSWVINVFVPSNHPDFFARWINETDPRDDPENAVFWAQTFVEMCRGSKLGKGGAELLDPFVYWAKRWIEKKARFLAHEAAFQIEGVEVGYHGHAGPNGARGTIKAFGKIGAKPIIGHSHSPGERDGVLQVGTSSYRDLEYVQGPSSWLHTHAVIYGTGKRSLINIIDGKFRRGR